MYKVGDRVKCIVGIDNENINVGCVYTIKEIKSFVFELEEIDSLWCILRFELCDRELKLKKILCSK